MCGGATFAFSQALMKYLSDCSEVIGIRHQVEMLCQDIEERTAGNSCSFLQLAVLPEAVSGLSLKVCQFVEEESVSPNWGVAIATGIGVPSALLSLGSRVRSQRVSLDDVLSVAGECGIQTFGGNGIIGAVAAVALRTQPQAVLLDVGSAVLTD